MVSSRFSAKRPLNKGPSICFPPPPPPPPELTVVECPGESLPSKMNFQSELHFIDFPPPIPPPDEFISIAIELKKVADSTPPMWSGRFSGGRIIDSRWDVTCGCAPGDPIAWHLTLTGTYYSFDGPICGMHFACFPRQEVSSDRVGEVLILWSKFTAMETCEGMQVDMEWARCYTAGSPPA